MRIVSRKTFLGQPSGTVFAKYEPFFFSDLMIKGDSLLRFNDFSYQQITDAIKCTGSVDFADKLFSAQETGESIPMDFDCQERDGLFDDDQLFAIFDRADVEQLINRLQDALSSY